MQCLLQSLDHVCAKCYWADPHFTGLNWHMNVVVVAVHFVQKILLCKGTDGGVVPLKQSHIQFLYKSHMSTKCLTLNAYILITIRPWLKGFVWGNYFWDLLMFALLLLSWYLLVWLRRKQLHECWGHSFYNATWRIPWLWG